ncbi:hypothetical protein LINPERHAP1_LOCUS42059 [Linum perenne]
MAGKPSTANVLPTDFTGMTNSQLHDIMSQMKASSSRSLLSCILFSSFI